MQEKEQFSEEQHGYPAKFSQVQKQTVQRLESVGLDGGASSPVFSESPQVRSSSSDSCNSGNGHMSIIIILFTSGVQESSLSDCRPIIVSNVNSR